MSETGCILDPARAGECIAERIERGDAVFASAYGQKHDTGMTGTWRRMIARGITGVFLRDREMRANGHFDRPFFQKRGTCVSRGITRAMQISHYVAAEDNFEIVKPIQIAFAPVYSLARNEIGKGRCGSGDGAIPCDAAKAVKDYGVATIDLFKGMSEDQMETLACKYAAPGQRTPAEWIAACKGHTVETFAPDTFELLCDCLAAGYGVAYAHNRITGMPNANGMSDLGNAGAHQRCFTGVFVDERGETHFESTESWGRFPAGDPHAEDQTMPIEQMPRIRLKYAGGYKDLAPGSVGVDGRKWWDQIQSGGEVWAVSAPKYRAETVADLSLQRAKGMV